MEMWDIYDANKEKTGRLMKKNDWQLKDGEYHLTVLGVIERPDGKFLITQRVMTKAWAPGWWEVSGGAAQAGEESARGGYVFTYKRENPGKGDNYFVDVYKFIKDVKDEDIHIQTEEALGYKFVTREELKQIAATGEFLHYDSIKQVFED